MDRETEQEMKKWRQRVMKIKKIELREGGTEEREQQERERRVKWKNDGAT